MAITHTKLRNGKMGIRSTASLRDGQTVTVTKRDGKQKQETVLWSGNGVWISAGTGMLLTMVLVARVSTATDMITGPIVAS